MSDYSTSYDGAAKDAAQSTIAGADFDTEFSALETAIATKSNKIVSPTNGNLIEQDASGDLVDSGVSLPTGTLVGHTDTQTLTNKTVVVASNTVTTAASGNLTATELNAALAELQADIETRMDSGGVVPHYADVWTDGSGFQLPSGWTSAKNSTGNYTVTHNLGHTDYGLIAHARGVSVNPKEIQTNRATNTITVYTFDNDIAADSYFSLVVFDYS